jgi:hypothetical protein
LKNHFLNIDLFILINYNEPIINETGSMSLMGYPPYQLILRLNLCLLEIFFFTNNETGSIKGRIV